MPFIPAIRTVFSEKKYLLVFFLASILFAFLYLYYPVIVVPGNDLFFQLSITPWWGFLLILLLAIGVGLLISMNVFVFSSIKRLHYREAGGTVVGSASSFIASVFGSVTCASCVTALFGFLGVGTVFLLLDYRWHIMAGSIAIIAVSLFFVSKRVNGHCKECRV